MGRSEKVVVAPGYALGTYVRTYVFQRGRRKGRVVHFSGNENSISGVYLSAASERKE